MTGYTGGIGGLPHQPPSPDCAINGGGGGDPQFVEAYDCVNDTLTITATNFDFTPVVTINYTGNGNGQIQRPPHFTLDSATQITIQQASFFLNGGVLTQLDFFVGPSVAASWTGNVLLAPCPPDIYPLLESICSPAADTVRFIGQRFLTASAGAIGYVVVRLADYASGCLDGPTMIVDLANPGPWTVVSHTDTEIELSTALFTSCEPDGGPGDFTVTGAAFHDAVDQTGFYYYEPWGETFSTPVDGAGCGIVINDVIPAGPNVIALQGEGFDQLGRVRVVDDFAFDEFFYDSSGPNAGLNPPGATMTVYSPNSLIIGYVPMAGLTITYVQARDGADAVVSEWYGATVVEA